jgi:predicted porin
MTTVDHFPGEHFQQTQGIFMKKSLLVLAIFGAFAGVASAQSSITTYGIVDLGVVRETGGLNKDGSAAGSVTRLGSGIQSGSRLGFKGTEDLGGGLKGLFQLETGIAADTGGFNQGGVAFARQSWVGLEGNFGMVSMGRQYSSQFIALDNIDPFGTGLAGNSSNLFTFPNDIRMNNSIKYAAPSIGGFTADVVYGLGEVAGNASAKRSVGGSVGYAAGPLLVNLSYQKDNAAANTAPAVTTVSTGSTKNTQLSGSYDFGIAKLAAAYRKDKADAIVTSSGPSLKVDADNLLLGVTVPFGASSFLASYIRHNDKLSANQDANQFALGYTYAVSKRTNLYTSYARISNDNGARFTVSDATAGGTNDKAFNVGIRHKF